MHMGTTASSRGLGRDVYYFEIASSWPYDPLCQMKFDGSNYALPYLAWVMEAMVCLMRGRTAFMIAHRLGTLSNCDARMEIEDGRVVRFE
jgi:hypothetical protein